MHGPLSPSHQGPWTLHLAKWGVEEGFLGQAIPQLSPEGRGDPQVGSSPSLRNLWQCMCKPILQNRHRDPGLSGPPLLPWFLPTSSSTQQVFVWTFCVLPVANWGAEAGNGEGTGPPITERVRLQSVPWASVLGSLCLPCQLPMHSPPVSSASIVGAICPLHFTDMTQALGHAAQSSSLRAAHQRGLPGGGSQTLEGRDTSQT